MRIDIISIFPEYLDVLQLSLLGKAQNMNLLDIHVHNLRDFTFDKHHTVDDSPYGGGAGMVMLAEVWSNALDFVLGQQGDVVPVMVVPTPAGKLFKQDMAESLAEEQHLIFVCGRYEGIDERFFSYAETLLDVCYISLGDYVLNGGEVAALAIVEAVGRLIPGVIGNPESLLEESHVGGFLEYPIYTRPRVWKGMEVPEVLFTGHHARIASWRREQSILKTLRVRPDLLDS